MIAKKLAWALGVCIAFAFAGCGGGGSDSAGTVGVGLPSITTQPTDQSVLEGSSATFSVAASGTSLTYQWSSSTDGATFTPIPGATGPALPTGAVTLAQNGAQYRVSIGNGAGSVTSSAAHLTVSPVVIVPAISVQPAAQIVTAPSAATFTVTATGTALTYVWQISTDNGVSFTDVAGAASASTFVVTNTATALSGQRYRVRIDNSAGNVTSAAAVLTVNPTPVAAAFTTQPSAQSVSAGAAATFTVAATGTPAPTIQWRLNGSNLANGPLGAGTCAGASVTGATSASLTLGAVPLACSGAVLSAVASNGVAPDAVSGNAGLTVVPVPVPPAITAQPGNQTALTGGVASFVVSATGPALTFQWRKNGVNIVGATAPTYATPAVSYLDEGALYSVVVANANGTVTSNAASLHLMLSSNQQLFENLILTPGGSYELGWNLNFSGPETNGVNYAYSDFAVLAASPLTQGPQASVQTASINLTTSLILPVLAPTRLLVAGTIVVVPSSQPAFRTSYVGSDVRVDDMATDGSVGWSQRRTNYVFVPLSGDVKSNTPAEMAHFYNSFWSNAAILKAGVNYPAGAGYYKFDGTLIGDRYQAFDCFTATVDTNISPCFTGTTSAAMLGATAGISSSSDGVTYHLADGVLTTIGGVTVWIANSPRPLSATLTNATQYRIYFDLNGNVYTGSLMRDGQIWGGSYYVSNIAGTTVQDRLTFLPYSLRLNKAARDGIAAAMAL